MRRFLIIPLSVVLSIMLIGGNSVLANEDGAQEKPKVELTKEQQAELDALYSEVFENHKQIINKYAEYGVFSREKADKIISKMEKHQTKLKENGYVPMWKHHKHHDKKKEQHSEE